MSTLYAYTAEQNNIKIDLSNYVHRNYFVYVQDTQDDIAYFEFIDTV